MENLRGSCLSSLMVDVPGRRSVLCSSGDGEQGGSKSYSVRVDAKELCDIIYGRARKRGIFV